MPKLAERAKRDPTVTAPPQGASAARPPPQPRIRPLPAKTAAPSGKQTKHKKSNPNARPAFNHRARFTKFKRRIHAQRRWVLEGRAEARIHSPHVQENTRAVSPSIGSSSVSEHDERVEVATEDTSARPRVSPSPNTTAATHATATAVTHAVESMDALFLQLDAAMKQRRFGRAAFLKRCLRARRHQLRRELQSKLHSPETTNTKSDDDRGMADSEGKTIAMDAIAAATTISPAAAAIEASSTYRSFYPSTTWLGVGQHSRSDWVDQRSGRYPKAFPQEWTQFILRNFGEGHLLSNPIVPENYACLIPVPPPPPAPVTKAGDDGTHANTFNVVAPPLTSTPVLTRAQRQQKAALSVASYCTNVVTDALDDLCFTLLQGLYKEQRDLKQKQPLQFKARQRYVVGFQEVLKCLRAGRVKLVLLAADVECVDVSEAELKGLRTPSQPQQSTLVPTTAKLARKKAFQSLHEAVTQVQQLCATIKPPQASSAPPSALTAESSVAPPTRASPLCVTCMSRQRLSYALYAKGSKVACVGVMQAEKNRDAFKAVVAYGRLLTRVYANELLEETHAD
ncbi:hypothetical protein ABB37_09508 [Leptomonas pyrrhocoris]|uniref:Ribosomal protein eL8/eL30/eS12/Gadd45 domain-containing protein n=1 Tax=Leptomonas pyrrhocoris TaxID=157538 RepID=A0A0M9FQF8_LEPPY|nr:hypothetical protein ABB37_09508 [Leptomonas pyrrhocoris]XP_015652333.1 hypothetical protein ABB37_09508 [Leptomonas pyrrhocoris]XP_015652334.1 hypothetical protein ABB37_09508 [Leptomonas pyrrhocoris]KPA73893.1 hypothetical protein ABB37_09508 [Leptomonas pyrrhocoris]KPA73894.1 hypothetical protein ABB37_09508 [Leptomonas pyrrhocoris]KPA73895.1 hypothetical protein ABB37_09508 [Leptomonas pyrrhocoris]|eukprot:XP_015652332.1 hypothetical protein ABB37_09508 [Leptomonas pyrrhocoris]